MPAPDVLTAASTSAGQSSALPQQFVVAWQHPERRLIEPVGMLTFDGRTHAFSYIRNALQVKDFRPLLGFADLRRTYTSENLFPLFAQRAMDPRRPDYQRYLARLGLEGEPGPLEQIARSQGRRQGDTIQLLPVPVVGDEVTFLFLVNGVRHVANQPLMLASGEIRVTREQVEGALDQLSQGDSLGLVDESRNQVNPLAVLVTASSVPIGWVPDLFAEDLQRLRERATVTVTVAHVNGSDAPWHLRLLARLHARPTTGFQFFIGEKWQPLNSSGKNQ